jgi:hypothetical protein
MTFPRIALLFGFAAIAIAQHHPNFSGTWTLNLAESDFTDRHTSAPDRLIWTVHHNGDDLKYELQREKDGKKSQGHVDVTIALPADQGAGEGTASARWIGDKLEFKLIYNSGQETQFDSIDTWSLSADGKKLTSDMLAHLPKNGGESHVRRVFDKK